MTELGRLLVVLGLGTAVLGALMMAAGSRFPAGRLPGDVVIKGENVTIWLPIGASILLSLGLTLVLWLAAWLGSRR